MTVHEGFKNIPDAFPNLHKFTPTAPDILNSKEVLSHPEPEVVEEPPV